MKHKLSKNSVYIKMKLKYKFHHHIPINKILITLIKNWELTYSAAVRAYVICLIS